MNIEEIKARLAAVPEEEWEVDDNMPFSEELQGIFAESRREYAIQFQWGKQPTREVAELVAHAPADLRYLIERVETLEARVAEVELVEQNSVEAHGELHTASCASTWNFNGCTCDPQPIDSIKRVELLEAQILKVQRYAEDRSYHAGRENNTVSSWRIAQDLEAIVGKAS